MRGSASPERGCPLKDRATQKPTPPPPRLVRGSPERRDVSEVYFVTYPLFLDYLKSIYVDATDAQLECMIGAPGTKTQHFEMCDAQGKRCAGIDVTRHPLR